MHKSAKHMPVWLGFPDRIFHCLLALCLLALFTVPSAFAEDHSALLGKWTMTSETDGDPVTWTLVLKDSADGKLSGVLTSPDGEAPAKDFTYDGAVIKFKAPYQDEYYDIELKLNGAKLDGTWAGNGNSGKTSGIKAS